MLIMIEYRCGQCGQRIEALETRGKVPATIAHCGARAPRVPSAVKGWMGHGYAVRRGPNEARPPGVLDTEAIADGRKTLAQIRAERRGRRQDEHRKAFGITPRAFSG